MKLPTYAGDAIVNLIHCRVSLCDWSSRVEDEAKIQQLFKSQAASSSNEVPSHYKRIKGVPSPVMKEFIDKDLLSLQPFHALAYPLTPSDLLSVARRHSYEVIAVLVLMVFEASVSEAPLHTYEQVTSSPPL